MSLEKMLTFVAYCDDCSNDFDTDEEDFYGAIEAVKNEGWAISKINGDWHHNCGCIGEFD